MMHNRNQVKKGSSLMEPLIVMIIIAILATLVFPIFANAKQGGLINFDFIKTNQFIILFIILFSIIVITCLVLCIRNHFLADSVSNLKDRNLFLEKSLEVQKNTNEQKTIFEKIVLDVLKNIDEKCLGKCIIVDPITKKYVIHSDLIEAEEALIKILRQENSLHDNPKFYAMIIDEDELARAKAA
jgi:hypothetical protein